MDKKYKPIEIFDKKELGYMTYAQAQKYENKVVRLYINKYGYRNVRGGDISSTADLVKRFGYYLDKDDWNLILYTSLLLIIILIQMIMYYSK